MSKAEKKIRRMEIEPAKNGGHTITHVYHRMQGAKSGAFDAYPDDDKHVFGPDQCEDAIAHIRGHLGIED